MNISSVCVYCGSSSVANPEYTALARAFGESLAVRGVTMIFGGGRVGLMGAAADACLSAGGKVIGIIPEFLERHEVGHGGVTELLIVDSMHTRKAKMADMSDAFVVLPGGFGTLDEFFEILTWKQLGLHDKPIVLVGPGYWSPLVALLEHMIEERFAKPEMRDLWRMAGTADEVFAALAAAPPSRVSAKTKWT